MENQRNNEQNKSLADKLRDIIFIESAKPDDEKDIDLIKECVDFLMEIEGTGEITDKQIESAKNKLFGAAESNIVEINKPKKKRRNLKALLIAACIVLLMLIFSLSTIGFDWTTDTVMMKFGEFISHMLPGEKTEIHDITVIQGSELTVYDSIEDFLNEKHMNVLYPTELPSGFKVSKIIVCDEPGFKNPEKMYKLVQYEANSYEVSIHFSYDPDFKESIIESEDYLTEEVNGFTCYFISDSSDSLFAQSHIIINDITYTITAPTKDDVVLIINNLKEFKTNEN